MAGGRVFYSDEERERLRRALQEQLDNKKLSYQELANDISDKVNYGLIDDSGEGALSAS